jgi:hypothetical protein
MDEFDHPFDRAGEQLGTFDILTYLIAFSLSLTACLLSFSRMSQLGPDVGAIIRFDPAEGPKHWEQPGISVRFAASRTPGLACVLMPSVISAIGGSFVIESKQMSQPPVFLVHWSGARTDRGARDCGSSADLIVPLNELRALANVAGGFGVQHGFFRY